MTSCTSNLILLDTDLVLTNDMLLSLIENPQDNNSIIIKIILDDIDDSLRVVKLETLPPLKSDIPSSFELNSFFFNKYFDLVPTYVKLIVDLVTDKHSNEDFTIDLIEEFFFSVKLNFIFNLVDVKQQQDYRPMNINK
jgi:hypothetical protein